MSDLLPPGNMPAWSPTDLANTIADTWQGDMWPSLWPRVIHSYANTTDRDADLAGLGPSDTAFAWTRDTDTLWTWSGSAWQSLADPSFTAYTPNWTQVGGSSLSIGNGSLTGWWKRRGGSASKDIFATGTLVRGSTTNTGTAAYLFDLPVAAADIYQTGVGMVVRGSENACVARLITTTQLVLVRTSDNARISNTVPGSWATGDSIQFAISYRAA